jgi:phosphopentomutase
MKRVILIVLDSVGVGAASDASRFNDQSANTFKHISEFCKAKNIPFHLPNLSKWGWSKLFNGTPLYGIDPIDNPIASTAVLEESSPGKDTTTGHWEIAGNILRSEFPVFEKGFSEDFLKDWCRVNNLPGWLGNYAASGTTIIEDLGEEHLLTGKPIVYTSADSVFQVAWSEEKWGLQKLYDICKSARKMLDPTGIGRIIARPFKGQKKGEFQRTENRRDYSVPPPSPNLLDLLRQEDCFVAGVGKIEDIFAHRSVNLVDHTGNNEKSLVATLKMMESTQGKCGLIFTNLIDFDQLHGHRRNPKSYSEALVHFDNWLPKLMAACSEEDLLVLTADHGNDPTHWGTDHTREKVPLLFWSPAKNWKPQHFGSLKSFTTIARLTLDALNMPSSLEKLPDAKASTRVWNVHNN